jgi:DNA-binding LacI/PurR family transcriptional regulator
MATRNKRVKKAPAGAGTSGQKRPTIGFIIDTIISGYQNALLQGADDLARERDVNLLCFVGGPLPQAGLSADPGNLLYDLLSKNEIDGLIISSGSVGTSISLEEMQAFCERFRPIPQASIALPIAGVPSV